MRSDRILVTASLVALCASSLAAQSYKGKGPEATQKFALTEGRAVFEMSVRGDGPFAVRLLDEAGNVVGELAKGDGVFGGSNVLAIPKTGMYQFDVSAPGDWDVRLVSNSPILTTNTDPEAASAVAAGKTNGSKPGTFGWLSRGFLGGLVAGPIGTALMVNSAGNHADRTAQNATSALSQGDAAYRVSYQQGYGAQLRLRQQRSAAVGGLVGSAGLAAVLIHVIHLKHSTDTSSGGDNGGTTPFLVVPLLRFHY